jgi:hypothetical protein
MAESGNGLHLLYPVDLPNDDASRDLLKAVLKTLAARFDNDAVSVDQSVFNAGRITKLYGTVANKGDNTILAPWRLSKLLTTARNGVVTAEQFRAVATGRAEPRKSARQSTGTFDLTDFLARLGIGYVQDEHDGRMRYKLDQCPFNLEHGKGESAVFKSPDGALGFKCLHNGCADRTWRDLRELVDGRREKRESRQESTSDRQDDTESDGHQKPMDAEPTPLTSDPLKNLPQFPLAAMPDCLSRAAQEVARFDKVPIESPATIAISMLGTAIGKKAIVEERDGLEHFAALFFALIAASGERKSPPFKRLQYSFIRYIEDMQEDYAARLFEVEATNAVIKARIKQEFGITCSVGVAPSRLTSKLAAKAGKPDGITVLDGFECWLYQHGLRHMGVIELARGLVGLGGMTS